MVADAARVAETFGCCLFWGAFPWGGSLGGFGSTLKVSQLEQDPGAAAPLFLLSLLLSNAALFLVPLVRWALLFVFPGFSCNKMYWVWLRRSL